MKFPQYTTTALEDWVSNWYIKHKFQYPIDLKLKKIAMKYEIFIHYKPMQSGYVRFGRYKEIVLNTSLDPLQQREQFFHEFCHAMRHVGKQSMMPEAFRELQERDARHFTLYAALPYHMIRRYDLDDPEILDRWSHDFKVSYELCEERLDQIKRRSNCTNQFYVSY
ncbi:ImmA/IrrE family metallo-endopeptidase [Halobacillus sp. HZG1]|uniref:ImmA/IrrE family metallo-endopeptidase n=1 Tax=unclassified Halobacillus TaxID=2636472 RepID=UPI001C733C65|nr:MULTISPECIES: ImmA/IrrE family metallo-endopeptidase [unclassified Halobacillus]MBX0358956.1 ImmA/IrrE family metallo-endopeptidase [Halobacillus sp. Nhm2S1]MEC3884618.1 ImmA/IrrE family metallo-endopeptidase [Halobacillus sp. HZG1]